MVVGRRRRGRAPTGARGRARGWRGGAARGASCGSGFRVHARIKPHAGPCGHRMSGIVPPLPGPIAIDARAAARPELGGVERWARELSARLPALRPGAYVVLHAAAGARASRRPRVGAARAAGPRAPVAAAAVPGEPRAAGELEHRARAPRRGALRHPGWYSPAYVAWQRRLLPRLVARARRIVTVSAFSRAELVELLGVDPAAIEVIPGGVDERFTPGADPGPARRALGLERPYVLCVASHSARKNLGALVPAARALAREGIDVVVAGGHRPQFAAESGLDELRLLGHVDDALLPGLLRGRGGVRAAVALRGLRAAGAGGDGVRDAGGDDHGGCAAGDVRRRGAARRRPGGAARGARRRCSATRPSASACARPGSSGREGSRGTARPEPSTRCARV